MEAHTLEVDANMVVQQCVNPHEEMEMKACWPPHSGVMGTTPGAGWMHEFPIGLVILALP